MDTLRIAWTLLASSFEEMLVKANRYLLQKDEAAVKQMLDAGLVFPSRQEKKLRFFTIRRSRDIPAR